MIRDEKLAPSTCHCLFLNRSIKPRFEQASLPLKSSVLLRDLRATTPLLKSSRVLSMR